MTKPKLTQAQRVIKLEKELADVNRRIAAINQRVDGVSSRGNSARSKITSLATKVNRVNKDNLEIKAHLSDKKMLNRIKNNATRMREIESAISTMVTKMTVLTEMNHMYPDKMVFLNRALIKMMDDTSVDWSSRTMGQWLSIVTTYARENYNA